MADADEWTVVGAKSRRKMSGRSFEALQRAAVAGAQTAAEDAPGMTTERAAAAFERARREVEAAPFLPAPLRALEPSTSDADDATDAAAADAADATDDANDAARRRAFPRPDAVVVLGLGSPSASLVSRYQLALALALAERFDVPRASVALYDPAFSPVDVALLTRVLGCRAMTREASDAIAGDAATPRTTPTMFFMPHCEAWLYENVLRAHWGRAGREAKPPLRAHSFCGNTFETYVERWATRGGDPKRPRRVLAAAGLIGDVERGGIAVEVDPTGSFDGRGAFNDTSVMVAGGAGAALPEVSDDDDDESP